MNLYTEEKQLQTQKSNLRFPREKGGGGTGTDVCTLLYIKQIPNKDLLYSIANSTQYSVISYMGIQPKKEWVCVYVQLAHFAVRNKLRYCESTIPQ